MARLDARQRRLLELLSETEWRSTEALFAEASSGHAASSSTGSSARTAAACRSGG